MPELCGFYSVTQPQILNGDYVILYQSIAKPGAKGFFYNEIEFTEKSKPLIQDFVSHVKKITTVRTDLAPDFYK